MIRQALIILGVATSVVVVGSPLVAAIDITGQSCQVIGANCDEITGEQGLNGANGEVPVAANLIDAAIIILGSISVIMIIISGIRYITSQGDSAKVVQAKNTLLYSIVGLVVAIFSYAIVIFVVDGIV